MEYKIKRVLEEIDLLELEEEELNRLNDVFHEIARKNYPDLPKENIQRPVKKMIWLNDLSVRVELLVVSKKSEKNPSDINNSNPNNNHVHNINIPSTSNNITS